MPKHGLKLEFEMQTRGLYNPATTELSISVDGKELPNMAVIAGALEECAELISERIRESYKVVPERTGDTPIHSPVKSP
jgi:hypothetical protein